MSGKVPRKESVGSPPTSPAKQTGAAVAKPPASASAPTMASLSLGAAAPVGNSAGGAGSIVRAGTGSGSAGAAGAATSAGAGSDASAGAGASATTSATTGAKGSSPVSPAKTLAAAAVERSPLKLDSDDYDVIVDKVVDEAFRSCDLSRDHKLHFHEFRKFVDENVWVVEALEHVFILNFWALPSERKGGPGSGTEEDAKLSKRASFVSAVGHCCPVTCRS